MLLVVLLVLPTMLFVVVVLVLPTMLLLVVVVMLPTRWRVTAQNLRPSAPLGARRVAA